MDCEKISHFVEDSHLLMYFFNSKHSTAKRMISFILLLFGLPTVLIMVSMIEKTLILDGKPIGILEDYLILSFVFCVAPLLFFFLKLVISRFIYFLTDIPSFTRLSESEYSDLKKEVYYLIVGIGKKKSFIFFKYAVGVIALVSNMSSIIKRVDGWNSFAHPVQLIITFIYLTIMLCFVINNVVFKYLLILWGEIKLSRNLARKDVIIIRPLAPDNSGGLRSMGELSLGFTYFLLPFTITGMMHYFTWRQLTLGSSLGLVVFIPLFIIVFFIPLGVVHRIMEDTKRETLHSLSEKYLEISNKVINEIKRGKSDAELVLNKELIEMLNDMYEKAEKMPVWPFNIKTLSRFISITFGPLGLVLIESIGQNIFGKFI